MEKPIPISAKTRIFCIIGHPITHSFSPFIHNYWFKELGLDFRYLAFHVHPDQLKQSIKGIKALNIKGFNVTIPHKETILPFIDKVDVLAQDIGAINTIKLEEAKLIGRNTDALGGKKALLDAGCKIKNKKVLILGAGGAARAISFALIEDIDYLVIANRTSERVRILVGDLIKKKNCEIKYINFDTQSLKQELGEIDILINTTPIGMFPNISKSPISKEIIHSDLFIFDLVYNPLETQLLKDAISIGCKAQGGLDMLINQGALAFEWWTNKKPNIDKIKDKLIENLMRN